MAGFFLELLLEAAVGQHACLPPKNVGRIAAIADVARQSPTVKRKRNANAAGDLLGTLSPIKVTF
ncbi:hypothetical protein [Phyllobacterium phragmitis]|uniref:hypothetical protein n=1 Tax=Phyllobacterium phragmitis TaxID=2670329 RepID=UPI0011B27343|nr:hypothetical protein [Phyllobacterium phragmitis]